MTKKEDKKIYEAPLLTVVNFKAERGYASSGLLAFLGFGDEYGDQTLEDRQDGGNWGGDEGYF